MQGSEIFADATRERLVRSKIAAVLVLDEAEQAVPLARALLGGGIDAMELTLRTDAALEGLRRIKREVPEMLCGVGTILNPLQVQQVLDAGGDFGVSPGTNPRVLHAARQAGLSFAPGVVTPSDVEQALEYGCRLLKFFPAEPSGGLAYLRSMAAPYAHLGVQYIPLGGIQLDNMTSYLADPLIGAVGGSWLAPRDDIRRANWDAITLRARQARKMADTAA